MYLIFDTETTGLSPSAGDRLVVFAALEMIDFCLTGNHLHFYINPECEVSEVAVGVHGLDNAFLADKPIFAIGKYSVRGTVNIICLKGIIHIGTQSQ